MSSHLVRKQVRISPVAKNYKKFSNLIFKSALFLTSLSLITLLISTVGCGTDPAKRIFNEAEVQLSRGQYKEAINTHTRLLKKYPASKPAPRSLFKIAYIYYHYLDDAEQAIKTFDELAFLYPESDLLLSAVKEMGEIYSTLDMHWKAVEKYEWLLSRSALEERDGYQYLIAMEYFKMNDFKQARIEFAEIKDNISKTGLAPEIYFRIATSFYLEKNLTASLNAYNEVINRFPEHPLAFQSSINIAQVYSDIGRLKEAKKLLLRLKEKSNVKESELIDIRIALIEERIKSPTKREKRRKR